MDPHSRYFKQVELLVKLLPLVAKYECFALKGGTAINLFVRDLPRLSVDIDLTYVLVNQRDEALTEIDRAFRGLKADLEKLLPGLKVKGSVLEETNYFYKLVAQSGSIQVKIETTPVMRGVVGKSVQMETSPRTQEVFGYARVPVVSFNDLYAGKLCAALNRQHPRDLFDISVLLRDEGFSEKLMEVFLVYLVSANRPIAELLSPNVPNFDQPFFDEFEGMTNESVTTGELQEVRLQMVDAINSKLSASHKQFLLSFKQG
ncbi:MAG: nucleotidyl transferase AbiEii/AbiGii toxin family protein, partial [Gammaproteobacteria bacterium]